MNQKYPAFSALLSIVANFSKGFAVQNESLIQKIEGEIALLPSILAFIPQAALIKNEAVALGQAPDDIVAMAELLVSDLAFSSEKAQSVIKASFLVAEDLASLVPHVISLAKAIEA